MNAYLDPDWCDSLRNMTPERQRAFLRAVMRLRMDCPECVVKSPELDRNPCYHCTILPNDWGRPMSSVN